MVFAYKVLAKSVIKVGTVGAAGGERRSVAGKEGVIFALYLPPSFPSRSESSSSVLEWVLSLWFFCLELVSIAWDRYYSVIA